MNSVERLHLAVAFGLRVGVILLVSFAVAGCAGGSLRGASDPALQSAAANVPVGSATYNGQCASCHGKHGEGMGQVPSIMGSSSLGKFGTAEDLFRYVKAAMPLPKSRVGSLSDEQYWAVVSFILACRTTKLPEAGLTPENAASVAIRH